MIVSNKLHVTKERILSYAHLSKDFNPIHVDEAFAETTQFGSIIAHGMLSLNLLWDLLIDTFGEEALNDLNMDVKFQRPVKVNETIQAVVHIDQCEPSAEKPGWNKYFLTVGIHNSKDEEVIKGNVGLVSEQQF